MQLSNEWFATAQESDKGIVMIRGRMHLDAIRLSGLYDWRIEMQWQLKGDETGMPTPTEGEVIDNIMDIACEALERSNTAILTAIHTGAQQVLYIFYATSVDNFSATLQPLLQRLGNLPLRIGATHDKSWDDYTSMIALQTLGK